MRELERVAVIYVNDLAGGTFPALTYHHIGGTFGLRVAASGLVPGADGGTVPEVLGLGSGAELTLELYIERDAIPTPTDILSELTRAGTGILLGSRVELLRVNTTTTAEQVLFVGLVRAATVKRAEGRIALRVENLYRVLNRPVGEVFTAGDSDNFRVLGEQKQAVFGTVTERLGQEVSDIETARLTDDLAEGATGAGSLPVDRVLRAGKVQVDDELIDIQGAAVPMQINTRADSYAAGVQTMDHDHDQGATVATIDEPFDVHLADNGMSAAHPLEVLIAAEDPVSRGTAPTGNGWVQAGGSNELLRRALGRDQHREPQELAYHRWGLEEIGNLPTPDGSTYGMLPDSPIQYYPGQFPCDLRKAPAGVTIGNPQGGYRHNGGPAPQGVKRGYVVILHSEADDAVVYLENTKTNGAGTFDTADQQALSPTHPGTMPERALEEAGLRFPMHTTAAPFTLTDYAIGDWFDLDTLSASMGTPWDGTLQWCKNRQVRLENLHASQEPQIIWAGYVFEVDGSEPIWLPVAFSGVGLSAFHGPNHDALTGAGLAEELIEWAGASGLIPAADIAAAKADAIADGWGGAGELGLLARDSRGLLELLQVIAGETAMHIWMQGDVVRLRHRRGLAAITAAAPVKVWIYRPDHPTGASHLKDEPDLDTAMERVITRLALSYQPTDTRGFLGFYSTSSAARELALGEVIEERLDLEVIQNAAAAARLAAAAMDWGDAFDILTFEVLATETEGLDLGDIVAVDAIGYGESAGRLEVLTIERGAGDEWDRISGRRWA